jgi:hypothetical protein
VGTFKVDAQILSVVLLAGCGSCDLADELRERAGAQASDCGSVAIDGDASAVDACVVAAMKEGRAFRAEYHQQGRDSQVVAGYAGNASGQVFFLTWTGPRDTVISSMDCIRPELIDVPNQSRPSPPIDCETLRDETHICEE